MLQIRTDLALEAHQLWQESADETTELPGVRAVTRQRRGLELTTVEILDQTGQNALGKPPGTYVTLELEPPRLRESAYRRRAVSVLSEQLRAILTLEPGDSVLVVGLGNTAVTPDAVGPRLLDHLLITRHLAIQALRPVSALAPGVLGTTGLESAEVIRSVVAHTQPRQVLVIDALVSREPNRICSTIQLTDTGIVPGSGIGNHRAALNAKTLGVPVLAIGVPTVVDARTLCVDLLKGQPSDLSLLPDAGWMVTPREISPAIDRIAGLLGTAINHALHPQLRIDELEALVEK